MKVILIDDEVHALEALQDLLSTHSDVQVLGRFSNPHEAILQVKESVVDAVFLDMEMPEMSGIEVAELLLACQPGMEVIFVTAYDHYAVEAFEVNALDYLLKPVSPRRMNKALERFRTKHGEVMEGNRDAYRISCFGKFDIVGRDHESVRWRSNKVRELFAYMVQNKNKSVSKDQIVEMLWPKMKQEKAIVNLHTCVYQIRKLIKDYKLEEVVSISHRNDAYQMQLSGIPCDMYQFEQFALDYRKQRNIGVDNLEKAIELYDGDYLSMDDFPWSLHKQEELQFLYIQLLIELADNYIALQRPELAITHLKKAEQKNQLHEAIHEQLMKAYACMGDAVALHLHYKSMIHVYKEELGLEPSYALTRLYERLSEKLVH